MVTRLPIFCLVVLSSILVIGACTPTFTTTTSPMPDVGTTVYAAVQWRNPDRAIDVVFIADTSYGNLSGTSSTAVANRQTFLDDIADVIGSGYYQNMGIAHNLGLFNFWYMLQTGNVQAPTGTTICPTVTWPNLSDAAFAEAIVMLHTNTLRDCAWGNRSTTEPTSFRTATHELGHAAFGLPDEYCCDGGYFVTPPVLYFSQAACQGDATNVGWRNCQSFTSDARAPWNGAVWWRSEDTNCDIMACGGTVVMEYGPADWVVVRQVLTGLGPGTVNDPPVFAPTNRNWPDGSPLPTS